MQQIINSQIEYLTVKEATGSRLTSSDDIFDLMREESRVDRECFWILHLTAKTTLLEKELISMGVVDSTSISPSTVFRKAIIKGSHSIILVHNHPSGNPEPSTEDLNITKSLLDASKILRIRLLDHIILGRNYPYSMQEENVGGFSKLNSFKIEENATPKP